MDSNSFNHLLAREVKAIVALAFRNGPIEDLHAGKPCPICTGRAGYQRISDTEMKRIMQNAVDRLYWFLRLKTEDPDAFALPKLHIVRGAKSSNCGVK